MRSLCMLIVDLSVAANNIKPFDVNMEAQNCVQFALLSTYRTVHTAFNNIKLLTSQRTVLNIAF